MRLIWETSLPTIRTTASTQSNQTHGGSCHPRRQVTSYINVLLILLYLFATLHAFITHDFCTFLLNELLTVLLLFRTMSFFIDLHITSQSVCCIALHGVTGAQCQSTPLMLPCACPCASPCPWSPPRACICNMRGSGATHTR